MKEEKNSRGMAQVYTGPGKGKTTAALGLALRAAGHGLKVKIVQFLKNPGMMSAPYGEILATQKFPLNIEIHSFGLARWVMMDDITSEDRREARRAFDFARELMNSPDVDVLILDEVFLAIHFGLIDVNELIDLMDTRPGGKELILTGRNAPPEVIEKADLVTEMREVKHYYVQGVPARVGIEF